MITSLLTTAKGSYERYLAFVQDSAGIRRIRNVDASDATLTPKLRTSGRQGRACVASLNPMYQKASLSWGAWVRPSLKVASPFNRRYQKSRALQESWQADTNRKDLVPGERKVDWLENHLRHSPSKIGMSFERKMIHRALVLIENRRAAWQKKILLEHGDPDKYNRLAVTNKQAGDCCLVGPDGMVLEAA